MAACTSVTRYRTLAYSSGAVTVDPPVDRWRWGDSASSGACPVVPFGRARGRLECGLCLHVRHRYRRPTSAPDIAAPIEVAVRVAATTEGRNRPWAPDTRGLVGVPRRLGVRGRQDG